MVARAAARVASAKKALNTKSSCEAVQRLLECHKHKQVNVQHFGAARLLATSATIQTQCYPAYTGVCYVLKSGCEAAQRPLECHKHFREINRAQSYRLLPISLASGNV